MPSTTAEPPHGDFVGRAYLDEYFHELNEEYAGLYRFWCGALREAPAGPALEVGVGPTLYSTIPLAAVAPEIHLADYTVESLAEIQHWLTREPGHFDWSAHVRQVLLIEGCRGTDAQVAQREQAMRTAITRLGYCDMLDPQPLGPAPHAVLAAGGYAIVTAHYCTEAACASYEQWCQAIAHLVRLLAPGGLFLLSVCTDLSRFRAYADQPRRAASPSLSEDRVRAGLQAAGLVPSTLALRYLPAPADLRRPYAGSWLAACRKAIGAARG